MKHFKNHGPTASQMTHGHSNDSIGHHSRAHHLGGSGGMNHDLTGSGIDSSNGALGNINT